GALTAMTPQSDFMNTFFDDTEHSVDRVLNRSVPINSSGAIVVHGTVNAVGDINVEAGSVTNEGTITSGAVFSWDQADLSDVVNLNGLDSGDQFSVVGGKIAIVAGDEIVNLGAVRTPDGSIELDAPKITVGNGARLLAGSSGDIDLKASNESAPIAEAAQSHASITIDGATLQGRDITLEARSEALYAWDGTPQHLALTAGSSIAAALAGINVGVARSKADARIMIGHGSLIDATRNVRLRSRTMAES